MKFCPFCMRADLALTHYDIKYNTVFIDLKDKPQWYTDLYPEGTVPFLMYGGQKLGDSMNIVSYIDEQKGGKLISACGEDNYKIFSNLVSEFGSSFYKITFKNDKSSEAKEEAVGILKKIEEAIRGPFAAGQELSMSDIVLFGHLNYFESMIALAEGIDVEQVKENYPITLNGHKFTKIPEYLKAIRENKATNSSMISVATLAKFAASHVNERPDYDLAFVGKGDC